MAFLLSCRWSPGQQEVYDHYTLMSRAMDDCRHQELFEGLSDSTRQLLDRAAVAFTSIGMPIDNRGDNLLFQIISERPLFHSGPNVADIFVRDDRAFLDPARGGRGSTITFVLEDGQWRMDLTRQLSALFAEALEGTGTTLEAFLYRHETPPPPDQPPGGSRLIVTNTLEHQDVYYLFVSPATSDTWGYDFLGTDVLLPGASCTIFIHPDIYDMMAIDAEDNTYTMWSVALGNEGYDWNINRSDLVQP